MKKKNRKQRLFEIREAYQNELKKQGVLKDKVEVADTNVGDLKEEPKKKISKPKKGAK